MTFNPTAVLALAVLLGTASSGYSWERPWDAARGLPFKVRSGIEIARKTGHGEPASLSMICSEGGQQHFILVTRLPFPRIMEREIKLGREKAYIYVGDINQKTSIVFELTNVGRLASTWGNYFGITETGEPDSAFSDPPTALQIDELSAWFGTSAPMKVSVLGVQETGVYMRGLVPGSAIRDFVADCAIRR
jgi:hypothetical protein